MTLIGAVLKRRSLDLEYSAGYQEIGTLLAVWMNGYREGATWKERIVVVLVRLRTVTRRNFFHVSSHSQVRILTLCSNYYLHAICFCWTRRAKPRVDVSNINQHIDCELSQVGTHGP